MSDSTTDLRRRTLLKTGALLCAGAGTGSLLIRDLHAQGKAVPATLTTGLKLANYGPVYVAAREGLFAAQGLQLSVDTAGSVAEPVPITLSGRGQFAATGTGMAVNATVEGGRMKVVSSMCGALGMWVITRPGTGFGSLADFRDKRVASLRFPSNTVTSPTYAMRKFAGLDPKEVGTTFIEGPPGSIVAAVRDGRADVGVVFEWDASIAAAEGLEVAYGFADEVGPILLTAVMVKEDYIDEHGDVIQRFCNALAASMKLIREKPETYVGAMGAEFNNLAPEVVRAGSERLLATPGFVPLNPVVSEAEWAAIMEHDSLAGTVRKPLPFAEMVDNTFAEKATAEFGTRG